MEKNKKELGITLIALIITIIILVILAAVLLRIAIGTGIIEVASEGVWKLCKRAKTRRKYIK